MTEAQPAKTKAARKRETSKAQTAPGEPSGDGAGTEDDIAAVSEDATEPIAPDPPRLPQVRRGGLVLQVLVASEPWVQGDDALALVLGPADGSAWVLDALLRQSWPDYSAEDVDGYIASLRQAPLDPKSASRHLWTTLPDPHPQGVPGMQIEGTLNDPDGRAEPTAATAEMAASAILEQALLPDTLIEDPSSISFPMPYAGGPVIAGQPEPTGESIAVALFRGLLAGTPPTRDLVVTLLAPDENVGQALVNAMGVKAQKAASDLPVDVDLLRISDEVSALAETLLLRETTPPISVGVLGGWGSGKSTVMRLLRRAMADIRSWEVDEADAWPTGEDPGSPYVGHVYQIDFDAWTYAKGDLWASLMFTIFTQLSRQLSIEKEIADALARGPGDPEKEGGPTKEDIRRAALAGGTFWDALWASDERARRLLEDQGWERAYYDQIVRKPDTELVDFLREMTKEERAALEQDRVELERDRERLAELRGTAAFRSVERTIGEETSQRALDLFRNVLPGQSLDDVSSLIPNLRELWATGRAMWRRDKAKVGLSALVTLVLFGIAGAALMYGRELLSVLSGVAAVAGVMVGWLRAADRYAETLRARFKEYREKLSAIENDAAIATQYLDQEQQRELPQLVSRMSGLERSIRRREERIRWDERFDTALDFLAARLGSGDYQRRLGLVQRVQDDLEELTARLMVADNDPYEAAKKQFFPRGPARIVLYIDDLDRCPPPKVVEVLEATQLLLKTSLFVVVIAMDVRYITRALEEHYRRILVRHGDPSGLDYVEKIIQIPYGVRPMDPERVEGYLEEHMDVEPLPTGEGEDRVVAAVRGGTDGGAAVAAVPAAKAALTADELQFTREELERVAECCKSVRLSPRATKRLVNVYKLLKIVWRRQDSQPPEPKERLALSLLTLSARYPEIMREVFDELSDAIRSDGRQHVRTLIRRMAPDMREKAPTQREWDQFDAALGRLKGFETSVDTLSRELLDLTRSFSFVGDIGHTPDERSDREVKAAEAGGRVAS